MAEQRGERTPTQFNGAFLAIGIGVGTALGVALDNLAIGVAIGCSIGVSLALTIPVASGESGDSPAEPPDGAGPT